MNEKNNTKLLLVFGVYSSLICILLEQGNILYRFPSLQRTASSQRAGKKEYVGKRWTEWVNGVEKYFEEKKWLFRSAFLCKIAIGFHFSYGINTKLYSMSLS